MTTLEPTRNKYIGHRYVPKIMGEWNIDLTYEGLSIVTVDHEISYTSKKHVPAGIDINNKEYWEITGNYNAQVEQYRQNVLDLETRLNNEIDTIENSVSNLEKNNIYVSPNGIDDTDNIKKAINLLPDGGYLHLEDGKQYKVSTKISILKPIIIIGHNAVVEYIGLPDNIMFEFSSGYSGARDLRIKKDKTISGITAFSVNKVIKGLFDNINFDDDIAFQTAFKMNGVKESQFTHIRLKNDLSLRTGTIFELNYCVNNTFSDSVAGYSKYLFNITETQDPVNNNRSEGIMINGFTSYYCETVVNAPNVTMLQIDNCIFDFTQKVGINCGNGGGLYINNTWIQLMHNDNSTAVSISANFGVASLNGLYIVGNKEMTNSVAFQVANRKLSIIRNIHLFNIKFGVAGNARDIVDGSTKGAEKIKNASISGYLRTGNKGGAGLLAVTEESFAYVYAVDEVNSDNYIFGFVHLKVGEAPKMRTLNNNVLTFGVTNAAGTLVVDGATAVVSYAFITPLSGVNTNVPNF